MVLFTSVTSILAITLSPELTVQYLADLLAANVRYVFRAPDGEQSLHDSFKNIVGVVGPDTLGKDILDAEGFHHCPNWPSGDNSSSGAGGFEEDLGGSPSSHDLVVKRGAFKRYPVQALLGVLDPLADSFGHFVGLPVSDTNETLSVTHYHEGTKTEPPSTLDDLGYTVDKYDLVDEFSLVDGHVPQRLLKGFLHTYAPIVLSGVPGPVGLELQAPVPDGFRNRLDPAMILEPAPVKGNRLYILSSSPLGQELSDLPGRINVSTVLVRSTKLRFHSRCACDDSTHIVIDDLGVNMASAPEDRKTWSFRGSVHLAPNASPPVLARSLLVFDPTHFANPPKQRLDARFAGLAPDLFSDVHDPFALVGFGGPDRPDISRRLADFFLVDAADGYPVGFIHLG